MNRFDTSGGRLTEKEKVALVQAIAEKPSLEDVVALLLTQPRGMTRQDLADLVKAIPPAVGTVTDAAYNALLLALGGSAPVPTDPVANPFTLLDVADVTAGQVQTSNLITVAGLGSGNSLQASISGDESSQMSKNGGAYGAGPVTVSDGDTLRVRHTASANGSTAVNTTLAIGTTTDTFTSTTAAVASTASVADFEANAFSGSFASAADAVTLAAPSIRYGMTKAGAIQSFAANALRRTDAGLRVTQGQTQQASSSYDPTNSAWGTKTNITIDIAPRLGPDGVTQFSKVIPNTTVGQHNIGRSFSGTASLPMAHNFLVEFDPLLPFLMVAFDSGSSSNRTSMVYDLEAGRLYDGVSRIGSAGDLVEEKITKIAPNQALIQVALTAHSAWASTRVMLIPLPVAGIYDSPEDAPMGTTAASPSYAGDGASGIRIWHNYFTNVSRVQDFVMGATTQSPDQLTASTALRNALNQTAGHIRLRLRHVHSPIGRSGLPLLVANTGEAILAQLSDTGVVATVGSVDCKTQLGAGTWLTSTVDVVLSWNAGNIKLCANGGPVATAATTKPTWSSIKLLQSADGLSITDGTILAIETGTAYLSDAAIQAMSAGLSDTSEAYAFWHDSASITVTGGVLQASASFAGSTALTPAGASASPTVSGYTDQLLQWMEFGGANGKRCTMANPGLFNGAKNVHLVFQARPRAMSERSSELGAGNTVFSQGGYAVQEVVNGLRVTVPHATTALIVDFPNCWFVDDAACYDIEIKPSAATDAGKVRMSRNGIEIPGTVTQPSAGAVSSTTNTFFIGAKTSGTEYGAFDLASLVGYEVSTVRSSANMVNDKVTKRHYDRVARCQLVAGGDDYEAIFAGTDGQGLALDYMNVTNLSAPSTTAKSLQAYRTASGDNKMVFALFDGPTTASGSTTSAIKMAPRNFILTGMGADKLPILAGHKINFGLDQDAATRGARHVLIEHMGFCPAYHTSGATRVGPDGGDADGLSFAGRLPAGSGPGDTFESAGGPEKFFARNNVIWAAQDEALSCTGWARDGYIMDTLIIALVSGQRPAGDTVNPSGWWSNESSHAYPGLMGYGANKIFTGREYMFDAMRRAREFDAHDLYIDLDIVGRQQNSFAFGPYSMGSEMGFASFGSKGEHTTGLEIQNNIDIDFIGVGARNGRVSRANKRPAISHLWNPVMVSRLSTRKQGVGQVFIGGPIHTDGYTLGAQRTPGGTSVATNNSVSRQALRNSPAFIKKHTMPPILTERAMRDYLRSRAGANRMPMWIKERMDKIERGETYENLGMLTSSYNDRAGLLGNINGQVDPATFAATYLAPRGLAFGATRYTAETLLPKYRELQELFARKGDARFY